MLDTKGGSETTVAAVEMTDEEVATGSNPTTADEETAEVEIDWICPKCNNSNFAFRTECNRCGEPRGDAPSKPRDDRRGFGRDRQRSRP